MKKNKNTEKDKGKKEFTTCCYPRDRVNSRAAREWMKIHAGSGAGPGQDKNLKANKRTALRIFGGKKEFML